MSGFSRRGFLKAGAAGLAFGGLSACCSVCERKRQIRVGVQLYSVRALCAADLAGTLKAIKDMGYAGVEFAGYYGKTAKELRGLLDGLGLVACGTHIGPDSIKPDKIQETIAFSRELGNKYLMVSGMGAKTKEEWVAAAKLFSEAAATAKAAGMFVGYHNHQHEFKDTFDDGKCKWETFFDNASPEVCQQMDVGHVVAAGHDPVAWLKRYPNRARTLHAKEVYPGPGILGRVAEGKQGVKWDEVFAAAEADVTEWYIVESEADPKSLDNIRGCFEFLKAKGRA